MSPVVNYGTEMPTVQTLYAPKTTLNIHDHLPPEPFTGVYGPSPRPPVDWTRWVDLESWQINRVEFALANPPLETTPPGPLSHTLTITGVKTLRDRGSGGAHVVTCFLDGDTITEYVAKIYDGVDYPLGSRERACHDGMSLADRDYSIEAWACRTMQPLIGGTVVIPTYHGSWTFPLPTGLPDQPQRWVRLILIELIHGECLLDMITRAEHTAGRTIDYAQLPAETFRIQVLQNIIEANLTIWWHGRVTHDDLEPRNIIVKPDDGSVVVVDFNQAYIYDFTARWDQHPHMQNDPACLPPSPIEEWWPVPCGFADEDGRWGGWVPQRWCEDRVLAAEWLVAMYRDDVRFGKPSEWWLNRGCHAGDGERVLRLLESLGRKPAEVSGEANGSTNVRAVS